MYYCVNFGYMGIDTRIVELSGSLKIIKLFISSSNGRLSKKTVVSGVWKAATKDVHAPKVQRM